jgi:ABC-type uncharacterized transport system permease subunit
MAAVSAAMFLVLDHKLKGRDIASRWFQAMPPVGELRGAMMRLVWLGWALMSVGIACGWMARESGGVGPLGHLVAAFATWLAYLVLIVIERVRGIGGRRLAIWIGGLYLLSLTVFMML